MAGIVLGASTGVVAFGGGTNGAYVFGTIGFIIGLLLRRNGKIRSKAEKNYNITKCKVIIPNDHIKYGAASGLEKLIFVIWNIEMAILRGLGCMKFFRNNGWWFVMLAAMLLIFLTPLGVIFSITVIVVAKKITPSNDYMINLR